MADTDTKAGRYELLDDLWQQILSEPGDPYLRTKTWRQGDIVELNEEDAERMLATGSVAPEGELKQREAEALQEQYLALLAALPAEVRTQLAEQVVEAAQAETPTELLTVHTAEGFSPEGGPRYASAAHGEGDPAADGPVGESLTQAALDDSTGGTAATRIARRAAAETEEGSEPDTAEAPTGADQPQEGTPTTDEPTTAGRKRSS